MQKPADPAPQPPDAPAGYSAIRDYLFSLKNRGAKYGIDRMRLFTEALGHPERDFPCIHVAGTNGKGSVCAMLEAIYRAHGLKTGLYTSPHLIRQGERVQVNRTLLDEAGIMDHTSQLRPVAERLAAKDEDDHPSFFEFMTAMAFLRFSREKVDLALLETGLGGRLDATNVVTPELAIITSISLDHTELLGNSLSAIAREKGGIIKTGRPVLLGRLPREAETVLREIARQRGSPVYSVRERHPDPTSLPATNLPGSFQQWNAAIASHAAELLQSRFPVNPATVAEALRSVDWAGRWQTLRLHDRTVILDATHNPEGARALEENLRQLLTPGTRRPVIVAAALGEIRGKSLMRTIAPYARELHLLQPRQARATKTRLLQSYLPPDCKIPVYHRRIEDIFPAKGQCTAGGSGDRVVVTGSLYLIGEVLERLTCETPAGQSDLQDNP